MMSLKLFGTDGIRAKVGTYPLTEEMITSLGKAVALYALRLNPHKRKQQKIAIIRDTRGSGTFLEDALTNGIISCGVDVVKLGVMPSASVAFFVRQDRFDLGIAISASHNDVEDNGLKFFSYKGYKLFYEEESAIEKILFEEVLPQGQAQQVQPQQPHAQPGPAGKLQEKDAKRDYIDFLKTIVSDCDISGQKIVIDCAFGAASSIAPILFKEIAKEVISLNDTPDGTNINKSCGTLHPEIVSKAVIENNAACGFAFDGDADRVIVCDEKGKVLDGDFQIAIIGNYLKNKGLLRKNSIVGTQMSNLGLDMCVSQWGGKLIKTEVGDKLVLEKMLSAKLNLGGEQSGHIIPLDYTTTGDGLLTALLILKIVAEENKPLSRLGNCMYKFPQVLLNIEVSQKKPIAELPKLNRIIAKIEEKLGSAGRVYVRYSGTENKLRIMIEGQNQVTIKDMAEQIAATAKEELSA